VEVNFAFWILTLDDPWGAAPEAHKVGGWFVSEADLKLVIRRNVPAPVRSGIPQAQTVANLVIRIHC
jgi:hypothetical protein